MEDRITVIEYEFSEESFEIFKEMIKKAIPKAKIYTLRED